MKLKYLIAPLAFVVAVTTGCKESAEYHPVIYMTDAQINPAKTVTIDTPPAGTTISVSASENVMVDTQITIETRPDLLEAYNQKYGKNYQAPPKDSYELSEDLVTIPAGFNASTKVEFNVTSMDDFKEGVTYCMPISIASSDGDMPVLEPSRTLFVVINTPVISKAMLMGSNKYKIPSFLTDANLSACPEITLEARIYMVKFATSDPFISSIMGIEGVCGVRFGDVKIPANVFQICHGSYQPAATNNGFDVNRWYHVAAVWTSKSWDIYIDGQYITGTPTQGETINLTSDNSGGFQLGASYGGDRPMNGYLAEVRVWSRALSNIEISNNMNYIDPASKGLVAYWRMNSWEPNPNGSGHIVPDLTGNGHNAVSTTTTPTMMDTKWF